MSVGEACEPTPRPNPLTKIPLAGKRYCIPSRIMFRSERVPLALFYVAEDLIEDMIVGIHEIDLWGVVFTREGPRATRRVLRVI
jgi:hypothetical protein